jgi:uncharacterized repeat protein (TIGR01451 family)
MCSNRKTWKWGNFLMVPTARRPRLGFALLVLFALLLGTAFQAQAAGIFCSDFGGVVDGSNPATYAAVSSASSFGIDMNCTVKNFPQSIGGFPITNINFNFPQQQSYYIVFQNVYYYGHMSCNDPTHSDFWIYWAPGGYNNISPSCQAFMVPVDAVIKKNPPTQTTAIVGVPFTYTITVPLLGQLDATGSFQYIASADDTAIQNIVITDDLSTSGAALTYISNTAYLVNPSTGAKTPLGSLALGTSSTWLANHPGILSDSTKHLVFSYENNPTLTSILAGSNIEIDLTVVLDSSPANVNLPGTQFSNTSNMWFNKIINSTSVDDLQAWTGTTPPMTIVEPNLVVTKTSSMSNLNVGTQAPYTINVQNTGGSDAWNATITDNLPTGMCSYSPLPTVIAQIYAADGVTQISNLIRNTDYTVTYNGCQLSLTLLNTAAAKIGPTQRLIITYEAMLDAGVSSGTFTNVAGATQWFSAASGFSNRREYDRTLTNGTPGILDFQDAYTMTSAVTGYYFLKSVDDLTTGASPATVAYYGDRLRYTLQIQNFNIPPLNNITINDDLGRLNGTAAFVPGSLSLASTNLPAGTYSICSTCGTNGAGTVTINGLNLGSNTQYQIQFDVTLAPILANGSIVLNQASLTGTDSNNRAWIGVSDDPYINGPALLGTPSDITPVLIQAPGGLTPALRVQKTVQDITSGTPTVKAGDTLRYTIKVNNIGTESAIGVRLRDLVPTNTTYVANTTSLNGTMVADPTTGVSALQDGMLINSPAILIPGVVPADANSAAVNTVTITFDVKISSNVVDGTVISNQGFVDGSGVGSGPFPEQPSDDPNTPVLNDPTSVVVGNLPLVYALKTVRLVTDSNGNGLVDPGDTLRYTITMTNSASTPATGVVLNDAIPANTTYVPNTTTLNGSIVADPSAGVSPLVNGMGVVSSGLTPPSPTSSGGTLAPNSTGNVTFDVQVNANVSRGTVISNQGTVATTQLSPLPTDSDGNPSNGYQPTVITVGNAQQLSIIKSVVVVGGGAVLPDSVLEYTIQTTNIGMVPATNVVITDDLTAILTQGTYVANSATMNGSTNGVSFTSPVLTATYGTLDPGASVVVRFNVKLNNNLATGTAVTNTAQASWNTPVQTTSASASVNVGGIPGSTSLNGVVWHDTNFNKTFDSTEQALSNWAAELYRDGRLVATVYTGTDGSYHITGLTPNAGTSIQYELRFRAPGVGSNAAMLGWCDSPFTNGMQRISDIVASSGSSLQNLNLPLTPNGMVYNSITRVPVAGATLTMVQASAKTPLPSSCFNDPAQQNQVIPGSGWYKFDMNFSDPSCPSDGDYLIQVTPPAAGYEVGLSRMIPPTTSDSTAAFSVPACPGSAADAVPSTPNYCEAQVSDVAPPISVPAGQNTTYYLRMTLNNTQPGYSQIYNNHIAIDPTLNTAVAITKTAALINVTRGQQIPYTITVKNTMAVTLQNLSLVDTFPSGFKYVAGSARIDGQKLEPVINTTQLTWNISQLTSNIDHTLKLLLIVGSGVSEGDYVNRAQVMDTITGGAASGVASATVRVTPDPTFDCTDIIGKVFDDANLNGYQDEGEKGLAAVRIVSARGLIATTDKFGRFHITCAAIPDEERGSNFILKLDDRSLPAGYRITTENPLVQRLTRGKAVKFNFGAALHRVVRLDLSDGVFEPGSSVMREQWVPRIDMLISELLKAPSILRISYIADLETPKVVKSRLEAVKGMLASKWGKGNYRLMVETEVYWRRGEPVDSGSNGAMNSVVTIGTTTAVSVKATSSESHVSDAPTLGEATEKQSGVDEPRALWATDEPESKGDRIEMKKVAEKSTKTVKLHDLVPAIHFASGEAEIPSGYIEKLRSLLDSMKNKTNVRLHLVGHTDNARLIGEAKIKYGDNLNLSRERAGVAAEYFQKALKLSPESVTYEGLGDTQPIATNATEQGKAQNRRVEIEVWYDEISDKIVTKEVVVPEPMQRVKICRVETVCKIRYKDGHGKRARVKNLVEPVHFDDDTTKIPESFVSKIKQALSNLGNKEHVLVKFIGYTDNLPLTGHAERIYKNHVSLSKARARRAALAVQDALKIPSAKIEVDGKGATNPVASNDTEKGRMLNQRIEVEFWYDDSLQELSGEPQLCPEASEPETVTRVFDSPSGNIKPVLFEQGRPVVTADNLAIMKENLTEMNGKLNARLRFIGYTKDERLERRTAGVYGDDIGLSTSRARRTMETVMENLKLNDRQTEFEGHGYVQSDDVVNTGFVESDTSRVAVQAVYDEILPQDGIDGLDINKLTREVSAKDPLALNLMHITIDGKPLDDPGKSMADIERCTDVALDKANIEFKFDNLDMKPRLNATAWPTTIRYQDDLTTEYPENLMMFRMYTNYPVFIKRGEIRIFDKDNSVNSTPVAVIEVGKDGRAQWQPNFKESTTPARELKYVLRVYDASGRYDETKPLPIWVVDRQDKGVQSHDAEKELLVGYGENHLSVDNIHKSGGTVTVYGSSVPTDHSVFVAGSSVPVATDGKFVTEEILPPGLHTVEVAMLDKTGNGELFLRDLEFKKNDWFTVGIADVTVSRNFTSGPASTVTNDDYDYGNNFTYDGRLAYYTRGKFGNGWELTSSADTLEGPLKDIFRNIDDRSGSALFRSIDPQYFYPTYGDDGSVEEDAPTLGKFYLKVKKDESYGMWGNFKIGYFDNDLAHVDRGLYGANLHYQTPAMTSFGEKRFLIDGYGAQPGTVGTREEFLGTGGSLYYLRHQGIVTGSESVRIEIRDKDSGIVIAVKNLVPSLDYYVDYLQGRITLGQPLSPTVTDNMVVASQASSGNLAYLVVRYEYAPSTGDTDSMSLGGRAHVWVNDYVKLGVTTNKDKGIDNGNSLTAFDVTLRKNNESWIKFEKSKSEGPGLTSLTSLNGGMSSDPTCPEYTVSANGVLVANPQCAYFGSTSDTKADAYRIDTSIGLKDIIPGAGGQVTAYTQSLDAGYSAPGLSTATDTKQFGGTIKAPVTDKFNVTGKMDKTTRQQGLDTSASEVDVNYSLTEHWTLSPGVRQDSREDHSPVVPPTQIQGDRTDAALRATYDSKERWSAYGFAQDTLNKTGNRENNERIGSGGEYRVTDRIKLNGEVSSGDLGGAGKFGSEYLYSDRTNLYLNYVYDSETPDYGIRSSKGNIVSGFKTRYSDSASMYAEEKYTYGNVPTGLTHAMGVDLAPFDHWNFGANIDYGSLRDPITAARLVRRAAGIRVGYGNGKLIVASAFEYRVDKTEIIIINPDTQETSVSTVDTDSWLIKNDIKYQIDDSSRILGKLYHAESSSAGSFFGGNYTEAVVGYGYRPVSNDKLNTLFKYTFFYNVPTTNQVTDTVTYTASGTVTNTQADFIQKSHILSLDAMYDLTRQWSIGGKYAYRLSKVSADIQNPEYFDSRASLYIVRADWHFIDLWDAMLEARLLDLPDAHDKKSGVLAAIYRQIGKNIKAGAGYNFSDFSDDLTQLSYKHQGLFINLIGEF